MPWVRALLTFVQDAASERKRGLFAAACCRRVWHVLTDVRSRDAVEIVERYLDGKATHPELRNAEREAEAAQEPRDRKSRYGYEQGGSFSLLRDLFRSRLGPS